MKLTNPTASNPIVGAHLVVGMHFAYHKLGIKPGSDNTVWLHSQGGYCLDAPEEMPGGGCFSKVWHPTPPKFLSSEQIFQTTVMREGKGRRWEPDAGL